MKINPEFPEHQRRDPNLMALLEAYDEIASSPQAGAALYHRPDDPKPCDLDFTIWVEEIARFGLRVANGEYCVAKGQWLHSTDGTTAKRRPSPIHRTWGAAAAVREAIKETTHSGAFVIPVVTFADMTSDADIDRAFQGSGVRPVWSLEDLVDQLMALVDVQESYSGLTAELIQRELRGFGLEAAPDEPPARDLPMEVSTGQVVIQHVDTLNVYTIGAHGAEYATDYPSDRR